MRNSLKKPYYSNDCCRLCQGASLKRVVSLGSSPVSEKYLSSDELDSPEIKVPLDLYFCADCSHVQLIDVVDPEYLWSDYTFRTGDNAKLVEHFSDYVARVQKFSTMDKSSLIVDVGSNDGTLLHAWRACGFTNLLGIDPASEIAAEATSAGIETLVGFLNSQIVDQVSEKYGLAKIVTANNVYAHCDDLVGMTQSIRSLLDQDGLFVFEASYLLDIVEKDLIGTIFHEHLSYHSLLSLTDFFLRQDMELVHVERGPEQGGSIVGYVQHIGGPWKAEDSVSDLISLEKERKLDQAATFELMATRLGQAKLSVQEVIGECRETGITVAGFGAARAGTTLLSFFEIGKDLDFLLDDNQSKHYKFSPGDHLEVLPTKDLYDRNPGCVVILAWIHAEKIIANHQNYLKQGGSFLRVFPTVEMVRD